MTRAARLRVEPLEDRLAPAAAGTLDPSFGGGDGISNDVLGLCLRFAFLPDGRYFTVNPGDGFVTRYNPDGSRDSSFSVPARGVVPDINILGLPDGGVLVIGTTTAAPDGAEFAVAR